MTFSALLCTYRLPPISLPTSVSVFFLIDGSIFFTWFFKSLTENSSVASWLNSSLVAILSWRVLTKSRPFSILSASAFSLAPVVLIPANFLTPNCFDKSTPIFLNADGERYFVSDSFNSTKSIKAVSPNLTPNPFPTGNLPAYILNKNGDIFVSGIFTGLPNFFICSAYLWLTNLLTAAYPFSRVIESVITSVGLGKISSNIANSSTSIFAPTSVPEGFNNSLSSDIENSGGSMSSKFFDVFSTSCSFTELNFSSKSVNLLLSLPLYLAESPHWCGPIFALPIKSCGGVTLWLPYCSPVKSINVPSGNLLK